VVNDPKRLLGLYILDEQGTPVLAEDTYAWAVWFQAHDRSLARTSIPVDEDTNLVVSTVFLGVDHAFDYTGKSAPVLWETMVSGGGGILGGFGYGDIQQRYTSREAALRGHEELVRDLKIALGLHTPAPRRNKKSRSD
jgi:hypothetical protein